MATGFSRHHESGLPSNGGFWYPRRDQEERRIALETGTQAMWLSRVLSDVRMEAVVIDAREVRQKARRIGQKSDRRDAFEMCDGMRRGMYTPVV